MATFAEMIYQGAQQDLAQPTAAAGAMQGLASGIQLAQQVEQIKSSKAQIEHQKEQLKLAKLDKFMNAVEAGQKYAGKAQSNYYDKYLPKLRDTLDLGDMFPDDALSFMTASPENIAALQVLKAKVRRGEMSMEQAIAEATDPEKLGNHISQASLNQFYKELDSAHTVDIENRQETNKQVREIESTMYKAEQKNVADRWDSYKLGGGASGFNKTVSAYEKAIKMLSDKDEKGNKVEPAVKLGTMAKNLPYGSNENVLARLDPDAKALVDTIRGGINIRAMSGDPNPTEKQINDILSRSIDPRLDNKKNIAKLKAVLSEMRTNNSNLLSEFQRFGKPVQVNQELTKESSDEEKKSLPSLPPEVVQMIKDQKAKYKNAPAQLKAYMDAVAKKYKNFNLGGL